MCNRSTAIVRPRSADRSALARRPESVLRVFEVILYAVTVGFEEAHEMGAASAIWVCRIAPESVSNLPGRDGSGCRRIRVLEMAIHGLLGRRRVIQAQRTI
jgi:hypothetical protein